jgi:hypothetical protein
MRIAIITDGPYGERAYATIKDEFDCDYIVMDPPASAFMDEIDLPDDIVNKLEKADIIISYILHPDLSIELVDASTLRWNGLLWAHGEGKDLKTSWKVMVM